MEVTPTTESDIVGGIPLQDRVIEFHKAVCRNITNLESLAQTLDTYRGTQRMMLGELDTADSLDANLRAVYDEILCIVESLGAASSAMARKDAL